VAGTASSRPKALRYSLINMKNESEKLFENILTKLGIGFSKIPESEIRTPDYKIYFGSLDTFWEVKEIERNEPEKIILKAIDQGENEIYSVHSGRGENSVKSAADQFKSYKVTDQPCIIVLTDHRDFAVKDFLFIQAVQSKMVGIGHYMQNSSGHYYECNRESGLFTYRKKYISAIAIMFKETDQIVFLHNHNANISFLNGPIKSLFEHHYVVIKSEYGLKWQKL
jgi:hypothetical protein